MNLEQRKAISELNRYRFAKLMIKNRQERIEMLDDRAHAIKSALGGDGTQGGSGDNKLDSILDDKAKLEAEIKELQHIVNITERCLEALTDVEREQFKLIFLKGYDPQDAIIKICEEYFIGERSAWRLRTELLCKYLRLRG